jgi:hypothetical protein
MICFSSAFVPLFQILGHRLEIRSQFGKGPLYVNVASRVCGLQTFEVEKKNPAQRHRVPVTAEG